MPVLQINKTDYSLLQSILSKYPYQFYAYGSRVKGKAKKYSDLDLCYRENIPSYKVVELEEELENSDLSFIVELVCWGNMTSIRQKNIQKDLTLISAPVLNKQSKLNKLNLKSSRSRPSLV